MSKNNHPQGYLQAALLDEDIKQQEFGDYTPVAEARSETIRSREFETDEEMSKSLWYSLATNILEPRKGAAILFITVALCAPVCAYCFTVDTSIDFDMSVPSDAKTFDVFESVEKDFGAGAVFPYKLLFVPKADICGPSFTCGVNLECNPGLFCEAGLNAVNEALMAVAAAGDKYSKIAQFAGITQLDGKQVYYSNYTEALVAVQGTNVSSYDESIALLYESFCEISTVEQDGKTIKNLCVSTYTSVVMEKSPFSSEGTKWLGEVRKELTDIEDLGQLKLYLGFGAGMSYDVSNSVYDAFPVIIIVTLSVVFVLMAVAFESLVTPIRSVLTLALTLSFVYGLAVLVYQHGAFSFLNMRCLSNSDGISWLPPVMCFSIIVGLGLDYDVFLISRVFEFRAEGYTDHSAAVKGICSTGFIITAAGLIMAVAFGGLFSSSELILNQTAFLLVFAVLLDTFVVRTLCVPALLGLTDHLSWWPANMTPATKTIGF